MAVINAGGCTLSTPSGPAVRDGVEGRTSLESLRDLSLKLFAFVGGENKQMLIKVSFVNQSVCIGTPCPLRPSIRVGLLHQHLGCSGTGTHPPPSTDPLPASLLQEVFPDIPPSCSQQAMALSQPTMRSVYSRITCFSPSCVRSTFYPSLKPRGSNANYFPSQGPIQERHCGIWEAVRNGHVDLQLSGEQTRHFRVTLKRIRSKPTRMGPSEAMSTGESVVQPHPTPATCNSSWPEVGCGLKASRAHKLNRAERLGFC